MPVVHRATRCAALAVIVLFARPVWGQSEPPADAVIAETLFREGRALLEAGDAPRACAKLSDSYRLDPRLGTLMNLAACHEMEGRVATAWVEFLEAARQARGRSTANASTLEETARGRAQVLASKVHRLELSVGSPSPDLLVLVDGREVPPTAWSSFPIDPGHHAVEARRANHVSRSVAFDIPARPGRSTVEVPALAPAPTGPLSPRLGPAPRSRLASPLFWGAAAVAATSVGVGAFFGFRAIASKDARDRECTKEGCSSDGIARQSEAVDASTASTALFVVGSVALVAAVAVLLWPARSRAPAPGGSVDGLRMLDIGRF